ncbi:hypothetical protein Tco_0231106 [Tanacetum coccineum]
MRNVTSPPPVRRAYVSQAQEMQHSSSVVVFVKSVDTFLERSSAFHVNSDLFWSSIEHLMHGNTTGSLALDLTLQEFHWFHQQKWSLSSMVISSNGLPIGSSINTSFRLGYMEMLL